MKESNQKICQEFVEKLTNCPSTPGEDAADVLINPDPVWSSCGSTPLPLDDTCLTFPVDMITAPTTCNLYVQEKFYKTKVETCLVYPCGKAWDVLQNHQLPIGYSKVTIDAVAKSRYCVVELDHPEDEDRKTLGENLGCQVFLVQALHIHWLGF